MTRVLHVPVSSCLSDAADSEQTVRELCLLGYSQACAQCSANPWSSPFPGFPVPPGLSSDFSLLFLRGLDSWYLVPLDLQPLAFSYNEKILLYTGSSSKQKLWEGWVLCVLHFSPWLPTFLCISAGVHPVSPLSWHVGKVAISNSRLFLLSPTDQPLPVITSNDSLFSSRIFKLTSFWFCVSFQTYPPTLTHESLAFMLS